METEIWKMYHLIMLSEKSDENIHQKKWNDQPWCAFLWVITYLPSHIWTALSKFRVYIKLDLEPLTYPMRQADLNYRWRLPLTCHHLSFPKQEALTPWKSPELYFFFNLLVILQTWVPWTKLMLLSSPLQAFLSAALVKKEAQPLPVHRGLACG